MGPEGKPVRTLAQGTMLMSENLSLVAKMRMWNSNGVHCVSDKIIITKKGTGQGMQATNDGKETEPVFRAVL